MTDPLVELDYTPDAALVAVRERARRQRERLHDHERSMEPADEPEDGPEPLLAGALFGFDSGRPALEYNVARPHIEGFQLPIPAANAEKPVIIVRQAPWTSKALRVAAVITGAWAEVKWRGCDPALGEHASPCPHLLNKVYTSLREIARAAFGRDGGPQVKQVRDALDELFEASCELMVYGKNGWRGQRKRHVLSFDAVEARPSEVPADARVVIRWDPFVLDSLMAGNFQLLPSQLVTGLKDRTAFRVIARLIVHSHVPLGQSRTYAVTGNNPTIPAAALGLAGLNRPARLRTRLRDVFAKANALQDVYRFEVMDREDDGLKVRVRRPRQLKNVSPMPRQPENVDASTREPTRVNSGTEVRQLENASVRESAGIDLLRTSSRPPQDSGDSISAVDLFARVIDRVEPTSPAWGDPSPEFLAEQERHDEQMREANERLALQDACAHDNRNPFAEACCMDCGAWL